MLSNLVISQNIIVDYKIITNGEFLNEDNRKSKAAPYFNDAFKLLSKMKMRLKGNKNKAVYWLDDYIVSDKEELSFKIAKTIIKADCKYYYDLNTNLIYCSQYIFDKDFIIQDSITNITWKLSKEAKKIGEYNCYKATSIYTVTNSKGDFKKNVEAWYTNQIPYRFGPKGFCGLPGLILQLTDDKITYVAEKIVFKKEDLIIPKITKGEIISQEKLDQLARKAMDDRRASYKKDE